MHIGPEMVECGMVDDLESDGEVDEEEEEDEDDVIEVSKVRAILGDLVSVFSPYFYIFSCHCL